MKNTNILLSYSERGIHIRNSRAGYTPRTVAEATIEARAIERELGLI